MAKKKIHSFSKENDENQSSAAVWKGEESRKKKAAMLLQRIIEMSKKLRASASIVEMKASALKNKAEGGMAEAEMGLSEGKEREASLRETSLWTSVEEKVMEIREAVRGLLERGEMVEGASVREAS